MGRAVRVGAGRAGIWTGGRTPGGGVGVGGARGVKAGGAMGESVGGSRGGSVGGDGSEGRSEGRAVCRA